MAQGRADHPNERRVINKDIDGPHKKAISGSSCGKSAANSESFTQVIVGNTSISDPIKNHGSYPAGKIRREFEVSTDTKGSQVDICSYDSGSYFSFSAFSGSTHCLACSLSSILQ